MEFASKLRWVIVGLVAILVLILIGWGLFTIAQNVFNPSRGEDLNANAAFTETDVKSTGSARFIVDGPVVANEEHRSYEIAVSQNVVSMKVYKNYGGVLIAQKSYPNTSDSFDAFLSALDNYNITARTKKTTVDNDFEELGVCPSGKRYIVELDESIRRWSTSCSNKQGTAGFSMSRVRSLFQKQVPDYRELNRGSGL